MRNHIEDTLRDVFTELSLQIDALEKTRLRLRDLRTIPKHREQAIRLEKAIDEISDLKTDIAMAWGREYKRRNYLEGPPAE